jgi:hypothetical protein
MSSNVESLHSKDDKNDEVALNMCTYYKHSIYIHKICPSPWHANVRMCQNYLEGLWADKRFQVSSVPRWPQCCWLGELHIKNHCPITWFC